MTRKELFDQIQKKSSFLCVGLDPDLSKIPDHLLKLPDPIFEFNRRIIDATVDSCVAYKPNLAFYETLGARGWESLEKTLAHIPEGIFTIADAKRGDIGNTSKAYAKAFFEKLNFDSITVAPYMGADSITPFLDFPEKWAIVLLLTSNQGSHDFQQLQLADRKLLFEEVLLKTQQWGSADQIMYVVGATQPEFFQQIRSLAPEHFFLVPGVGAQGGDLEAISKFGMNKQCGLLVNSSRGILFQSRGKDFEQLSKTAAMDVQQQMSRLLDHHL